MKLKINSMFLGLLLVLVTITCSCAENTSLQIGTQTPIISLPSINGEVFSTETLLGKPYLLTFYTTWSQSCINNLKSLQDIKNKHNGINIVAVSFDKKISVVDSFLKNNGFSFISLIDKKQKNLDAFHVIIIPMTLLIDKNGTIKSIYRDFDNSIKNSMDEDIQKLLKETT